MFESRTGSTLVLPSSVSISLSSGSWRREGRRGRGGGGMRERTGAVTRRRRRRRYPTLDAANPAFSRGINRPPSPKCSDGRRRARHPASCSCPGGSSEDAGEVPRCGRPCQKSLFSSQAPYASRSGIPHHGRGRASPSEGPTRAPPATRAAEAQPYEGKPTNYPSLQLNPQKNQLPRLTGDVGGGICFTAPPPPPRRGRASLGARARKREDPRAAISPFR